VKLSAGVAGKKQSRTISENQKRPLHAKQRPRGLASTAQTQKKNAVEDKRAGGDGERRNQKLLLRVRQWRCGVASQQKKNYEKF
jgi:hypothetical protein